MNPLQMVAHILKNADEETLKAYAEAWLMTHLNTEGGRAMIEEEFQKYKVEAH